MNDALQIRVIMNPYDTIDVPSLVESVCSRPAFYTATGTLEEVFCYLSGIYAGLYHQQHSAEQRAHALREWYDFLGVTPSLLWPPMREWGALYQAIRSAYADDQAALAYLAQQHRAYRQGHR